MGCLPRGDDGMMVGDFRAVKDTLAPGKGIAHVDSVLLVGCQDIIKDALAFRIDVIAEIACIDTRIGGQLLLVERLYGAERGFGWMPNRLLQSTCREVRS